MISRKAMTCGVESTMKVDGPGEGKLGSMIRDLASGGF
jgi:hypothetical protein